MLRNGFLFFFFVLLFVKSGVSQTPDCKKWKNGNFAMYFEDGTKYSIIRKGAKQIEHNSTTGWTAIMKVKWIDACTYELKRSKVVANPSKEIVVEGLIVTVKIVETFEDYCLIDVHSNRVGNKGYRDLMYIDKER